VTELTTAQINPQSQRLLQNIAAAYEFNLPTLSLAAVVFSLGKLTVYAAGDRDFFVYSACAVVISQLLLVASLLILGRFVSRLQIGVLRATVVVAMILLLNIAGTILFEAILRSWNLEPISQTIFQRAISLAFATFIYLGFGWVFQVLGGNLNQVGLAKRLLADLSRKQLEITREIRDARTFSIREISLEIQSTLGTLDNYAASSSLNQSVKNEIDKLQTNLQEIDFRVNQIASGFPGPVRMPKINSKLRYSFSGIISSSTKPNSSLTRLISVVSFFGFCSWLSYYMNELHAAFWGITLSALSYCIFFCYEKYLAPGLLRQVLSIRIFAFELFVVSYLFFWLLVLGYFAGDDFGAYSAALAYAAIPFIFFNGGAVLGGVVISSLDQREQLTIQASLLRQDLAKLEQIRSDEDKVWKSLFAGDIALSPTTASVILRDSTMATDNQQVLSAMRNVNSLWNSVLKKISNTT